MFGKLANHYQKQKTRAGTPTRLPKGALTSSGTSRTMHSYLNQQQRSKFDQDLEEENSADISRRSSRRSSRHSSNDDDIFSKPIRTDQPRAAVRKTHSPIDSLDMTQDEKFFKQFKDSHENNMMSNLLLI